MTKNEKIHRLYEALIPVGFAGTLLFFTLAAFLFCTYTSIWPGTAACVAALASALVSGVSMVKDSVLTCRQITREERE